MRVSSFQTNKIRLGNVVHIRTGRLDANASSADGEYPFFTCSEVPLRISSFSYDCECVLISGNGDLNVKYYSGKFDAYQRTYIIESADKNRLDTRYLFHFMSIYVGKLRDISIGGVIKYIKIGYLTEAQIPLPPLPEQKRIAAILDEADELRAKRRAAIAKLDEMMQAIFLEIFGDPTCGIKPNVMKIKDAISIGAIIEIQDGNHGEKHPKATDFINYGIPFITADCLHDDKIDLTRCSFLSSGWLKRLRIGFSKTDDVLISHKGSIGLSAIVPSLDYPIILSPQVTYYRLNIDMILPRYLLGFFRLSSFQAIMAKEAIQTTRAYIGITRQLDLPILIPSIDLQRKYCNKMVDIEKQKMKLINSLVQLDALFSSLQHRAFQGEL